MNTSNKVSRVLGVAFLLQFITSVSSGLFIRPLWLVSGNIRATMLKIAENPAVLRINILVDMLTSLGVIWLGAVLFATLKKQNEKVALTALGFYILEGALLAASRIGSFSLLKLSQGYASTGQPESLLVFGNIALEAADYVGDTLHVLAFCLGAILFYILLYKSKAVPRWLSLWGLITLIPVLAGTLTALFDVHLPFIFFLPYFPFEFVIGVWVLVKGIPVEG
jgi:Domain of unknown function (DUF4386)